MQKDDGSWINGNARWLEGDPNLVTAYSLLALVLLPSRKTGATAGSSISAAAAISLRPATVDAAVIASGVNSLPAASRRAEYS